MAHSRVRLCGKAQVLDGDGAWVELPRKGAALLARLIIDGPLSRELLADQLWPEATPDKARGSLRGVLRDMRRLAARELVEGTQTLQLAAGVEHDLDEPAEAPDGSGRVLLGAYDFGDLDAFDDWLQRVRQRVAARVRRAALARVAQLEASSHLREAVVLANQLAEQDLLDEGLCRQLMRLHQLCGDSGASRMAYRRCHDALAQSLQREPEAATRSLLAAIESGEPLQPRALPMAGSGDRLRPVALVARDHDLAAIHGAWARHQGVLLIGESGIGKSHLLQYLAMGRAGAVRVPAHAGDEQAPYALLARLLLTLHDSLRPPMNAQTRGELARIRPEFGPVATHPASARRLADAVADALDAWRAAGLTALLIDDFQWADAASQRLLLAVAAQGGAGLDWLLATRPEGAATVLDAAPPPAALRWQPCRLAPLGVQGIAALLRALPAAPADVDGWAKTLTVRAHGNPLLTIETVRALGAAGVPLHQPPPPGPWPAAGALDDLLPARLMHLSARRLHLAQLVALAGTAFVPRLATELLGVNPLALSEDWAALRAEGVLGDEALAHDSLRAPLLAMLPPPMARELHARIAAEAQRAGIEPAEVAAHWLGARQWPQAAASLQAAAERAYGLAARADELRFWDEACACHERLGDGPAAFAARVRAFDAALEAQSPEQAEQRAQALLQHAADDGQRLDARLALARSAATAYRHADALAQAREAEALALRVEAQGERPRSLRVSMLLAAALAGSGQAGAALELLDRDQGAILGGGDDRLQMDCWGMRGYVSAWAGRFDDAIAAYRQGLVLAERLDDAAEAATMASNLATALARQGDCEAALRSAQASVLWRRRTGELGSAAGLMAQQVQAMLLLRLGRLGEALTVAEAALAITRSAGLDRLAASCETTLARIWLDLGRADRARACLRPWPVQAAGGGVLARRVVEAAITQFEGDDPLPQLQAAAAQADGAPLVERWALDLALAPWDDAHSAVERCSRVAAAAAQAGATAFVHAAQLRQAEARCRAGDTATAAQAVRGLQERLPHCLPADTYLGEFWCLAARVHAAAGNEGARRQALAAGRRWLLDKALPAVAAEHRRHFLRANRANRELLRSGSPRRA